MTERMSGADVSFLHRETGVSPQHVGGIAVFEPPAGGFDYDRLVRLIEERITLAPRYRQKVRSVPGHIANPMWVDDPSFDITYHVRRSALPRPGTEQQLLDFGARILARPLDRSRPLWEIYLVEGLAGGRVAIVTKTHEAMVGEDGGIDLTQVILDAAPAPRRTVEALWFPGPEPSAIDLVREAVGDIVRRPVALADTARLARRDVAGAARRVTSVADGVVSVARAVLRRKPTTPLSVELCEHRRLAVARTRLADYRMVRDTFGGTINDVALAVVSGALRGWLLARAEPLRPATTVRALVPVSVTDAPSAAGDRAATSLDPSAVPMEPASTSEFASQRHPSAQPADGRGDDGLAPRPTLVRPLLVDLPVGEPDPVLRLAQLRYAMASHKASGRAVGADRIATLGGYAPPTLHALGARAATGLTRRMFSLVVTNVPGPQLPLYAAGAQMVETFPVQPLSEGQALSIALSSYDHGVYFGINGDRDAVPDIALIATLVEESLAELVSAAATGAAGTAAGAYERGPRSRRASREQTGTPGARRASAAPRAAADRRQSSGRRSPGGRGNGRDRRGEAGDNR